MVAVSLYTHLSVKVLHGVVPVGDDGSACFTVPADRNIFFQALDGDFMEVQRMRTFVNFQPGERRSCVGCHERAQPGAAESPVAGRPVDRPSPARSRSPATRPPADPLPDRRAADLRPALHRVSQLEEGRGRPGS